MLEFFLKAIPDVALLSLPARLAEALPPDIVSLPAA